jgi:nitroreductase
MSELGSVPLEFAEHGPAEMTKRSRSFYEDVRRRRSVRDFDERPVPLGVLENALCASGTAPSGANMQPWHFVVVSDPETKRRIRVLSEEVERGFYEQRASEEWLHALEPLGTDASKPFLEEAPVLVVVFVENYSVDAEGGRHKTYYPMESVGIAAGVLISALHVSGLASLVYTPAPMGFLSEVLDRPDTERPFLVLAVGYPKEGCTVPSLDRKPLEAIATFVGPGDAR